MTLLSSLPSAVMEVLRILFLIGQILFSLAAVFLLCLVMKTYLIGPYYRKLHLESKGNKEILVLGVSAFTFLMLTVTSSVHAVCTVRRAASMRPVAASLALHPRRA